MLALAVAAYALERRSAARAGGAGKAGTTADEEEGTTADEEEDTTADEEAVATDLGDARAARDPAAIALGVLAAVLGALLFAGSLEDGGREGVIGLFAGAACAALGYLAVVPLLTRARRRLERSAASLLGVYADAAALVLAALSILVPPVGLLALVALVYLMVAERRQQARKYGGLRILR